MANLQYLKDGILRIPEGITSVGGMFSSDSYKDNLDIIEVYLPDSLTEIRTSAFQGCKNLRKVHFGNNLQTIELRAFSGCLSLEEVILPDSVEVVNMEAFYNCHNVMKLRIGPNIRHIAPEAFEGCYIPLIIKLSRRCDRFISDLLVGSFLVLQKDDEKNYFAKEGDFLTISFDNEKAALKYYGNSPKPIIPNGTTVLWDFLFAHDENIKELVIPEGVRQTCTYFAHLSKVEKVYLPSSMRRLGYHSFSYSSIEEIHFNEGLDTINSASFTNCNNLKEAILPDSVFTLGRGVFSYCNSLKKVRLSYSIPKINDDVLSYSPNIEELDFNPKSLVSDSAFYESKIYNCKRDPIPYKY